MMNITRIILPSILIVLCRCGEGPLQSTFITERIELFSGHVTIPSQGFAFAKFHVHEDSIPRNLHIVGEIGLVTGLPRCASLQTIEGLSLLIEPLRISFSFLQVEKLNLNWTIYFSWGPLVV